MARIVRLAKNRLGNAASVRMRVMENAEKMTEDRPVVAEARTDLNCAEAGDILFRVFDLLDRHGIRYCVLHGYEDFAGGIKSDVDCVIGAETVPSDILNVLRSNGASTGADVVRCNGFHILLASQSDRGPPRFLALDFTLHAAVNGLLLHDGAGLLETRRRHDRYWIPAPELEFGCYLARSIAKGVLDDRRARRLSHLYRQNPSGCEGQVARFWTPEDAGMIVECARSGDWSAVLQAQPRLRATLRRGAVRRHPWHFAAHMLQGLVRRAGRILRPEGLHVVLLGPDGAGKSSTIDAVALQTAGAFRRWICLGFAPALLHVLRRRRERRTDQPHALPARSVAISLLRAAYWLAYYTLGYLRLHFMLARSTLVLNDRHFVDILVDPKRYRYGGPMWLLRLIWRLIPKPNLFVLLDAPPEVLQSRKQEVPFDVTAQQRTAYLNLVQELKNGVIVDANRPRALVSADVSNLIVQQIVQRTAARLRSGPNGAVLSGATTHSQQAAL
jgi:thymidylate kinase